VGATIITEGGDLKNAQEQSAAMAKAKTTLLASAQHGVDANPGARVISVYPELQNGRLRLLPCCAATTSRRTRKSWIEHPTGAARVTSDRSMDVRIIWHDDDEVPPRASAVQVRSNTALANPSPLDIF
jgi:hypothetical protein